MKLDRGSAVRIHGVGAWLAAAVLAFVPACRDGNSASQDTDTDTDGTAGEAGTAEGDESTGTTGLPPIDPEICLELTFDNVVDEASCPEIQGRGIDPEFADDVEMCRRLTIDLLGYAPTPADYHADCRDRTVGEIVADFVSRDEYVGLGQRIWADKLLMTSDVTYYPYVESLDLLVEQLYRGQLMLPEFAIEVVTHEGFTGRFAGQDLPGYAFLAFLGRDAAPHERLELEPLWHMWQDRYIDNHPTYFFGYAKIVVNTIMCMGSNEFDCHSELWGHHSVVIPPVEEDNYDYDGVNVFDLTDLSGAHWDELQQPGVLLTQQPTFYETAADEALVRYLGYEAGAQIPLVRQKLADMLSQSGGDIREMEREILTSQLYRMASAYPDPEGTLEEDGSPDFWHGPMKQLTAEAWLDSVERLAGVELGSCDHRYPSVQNGRPEGAPYEQSVWHPNSYPKDDEWPLISNKPDYTYRDLAQTLGGCPEQQSQLRFTGTGVMIALSQSNITQEVCAEVAANAPIAFPGLDPDDKSVTNLTDIAEHIYRAALIRPIPEDLQASRDAAVSGCRDDTECDASTMAFYLCSAMLRSAPFIFY